jgi:N-acetylmuramoyl-L-alanine amidase
MRPARSVRRLAYLALLICGLPVMLPAADAWAQGLARAAPPPAVGAAASSVAAVDARLESGERSARFRLSLSGPVAIAYETLDRPMRIIAELPEVSFQALQQPRRPGVLVTQVRAGLVAPGRSRIVFELGSPAMVSNTRQVARSDGITDLVIEFQPANADAFADRVARDAERRAAVALAPLRPAPQGDDLRPLVVIDPGHGGIDPGAVAPGGIAEKAVVLAIGQRLMEEITASGAARVMMTRSDDRFLSLSERVRLAREARADLFVSLHADSLSATQDVRGATIYTGSDRASDAESARLAQKENASDALGGADTTIAREEINDILMDLARRETRALSSTAAARLVTEMSGAVQMHRIPQRAAGFRVLTAPDVPSLLIELGYLSSRHDVELLTSSEWQGRAARAIARAVLGHFSAMQPQGPRRASISP